MKKINKKIMYSMGAVVMVSSPIIAVLSCGKTKQPISIDLSKVKSVSGLIQEMNKSMHFIAKKPADVLGKPISSADDQKANQNYPLTKDQYKGIADGVIADQTFNFSFNGKTQSVTSNFHNDTQAVKDSVNEMITNWSTQNGTQATVDMKRRQVQVIAGGPNMSSYVANLNMTIGLNSTGYLSLTESAWNAYKHELTSWSNFTWSILQTSPFQEWMKTNKPAYLSPKSGTTANASGQLDKTQLVDPTITNPINKSDSTTNGINMDAQKSALPKLIVSRPATPSKISNLELEFGYMIQNLYSPDALK